MSLVFSVNEDCSIGASIYNPFNSYTSCTIAEAKKLRDDLDMAIQIAETRKEAMRWEKAMTWNLNYMVQITLMDDGPKIYHKAYPNKAKPKVGDKVVMQGHELISVFGESLYSGFSSPFSMEVKIENEPH